MTDPYTTLGVPRTASQAQVREAYRRKAKQFHPDLVSDAQATERMQRINQAWQALSSPAARARYDDYTTESEASPLRWAVTVAALLFAAFVLAAIFGGAFPAFGLLLFFVARALLRSGD